MLILQKAPLVITIILTTEVLKEDVDIEKLDRIILIPRDRFENYYGNIISQNCLLYIKYTVNESIL